MSEPDRIISDMTAKLFEDLADPQTVNSAADNQWESSLWDGLEEVGLTRTWVPDALGGAGASIRDGFEVLRVAGRFAVSVPLGETLLAGWMLPRAGIEIPPSGRMTVVAGPDLAIKDGAVTGAAPNIPFASVAEHIVVVVDTPEGPQAGLVEPGECTVNSGESLSREPRDTGTLAGVKPRGMAPKIGRAHV